MSDLRRTEQEFLQQVTKVIEENIANEQFGVSELACEAGMSRSNLLRKVKKQTGLSVSRFIRQVRLNSAMQLLKETSLTTSEISYRTGFSSSSYFIKCFREYYGYPPGEAVKRISGENREITGKPESGLKEQGKVRKQFSQGHSVVIVSAIAALLLGAAIYYLLIYGEVEESPKEKSIAVLPFKNDSNDSSNVYIINGLMEAVLNDLQKIEDLRVISRTSTEKYRDVKKSISEIAKELDVQYFVEGSGQKSGNHLLLNIQLIDGRADKHLWSRQYVRNADHIFELQNEIAENIAGEIRVVITPAESERIGKRPTNDLVAYDWFLKGLDLLKMSGSQNIRQSIEYFRKAVASDSRFARAYAATAIAYYFLDNNQSVKHYPDSVNYFSDQAMFYDPQLPQSLIAKGLFYMTTGECPLAEPYFEKALEYSPNYDLALFFLIDLYVNHLPDTEKYLEYALRGLEIDLSAYDSTVTSFNYLHISNAFIQNGFVDEAIKYINKSLDYKPDNLYSQYTRAYILFARNRNLDQTRELLRQTLEKDSNRLDILQEVGKICYYQGDYESAFHYYRKYVALKSAYNLDIYPAEDARIGYVYAQMGAQRQARNFFDAFKAYAESDQSIYKQANLALYYSYMGDVQEAMRHLELFANESHYYYWTILFFEMDPLADNIKKHRNFKKVFRKIENKFRERKERIKVSLAGKGLI